MDRAARSCNPFSLFWSINCGPMCWIWSPHWKPPTRRPQGHSSSVLAHLGWDLFLPQEPVPVSSRHEDHPAEGGGGGLKCFLEQWWGLTSTMPHPNPSCARTSVLCTPIFTPCSAAPSHVWASALPGTPLSPLPGAVPWEHFNHQTAVRLRHRFNQQRLDSVPALPTSSSNEPLHRHPEQLCYTQHYKP